MVGLEGLVRLAGFFLCRFYNFVSFINVSFLPRSDFVLEVHPLRNRAFAFKLCCRLRSSEGSTARTKSLRGKTNGHVMEIFIGISLSLYGRTRFLLLRTTFQAVTHKQLGNAWRGLVAQLQHMLLHFCAIL